MNPTLIAVSQQALERLRQEFHADSLTCYFFNPFSKLYWLFHRTGKFRYPWQMWGPLTHPEQGRRMGEPGRPDVTRFIYNPLDRYTDLSGNILNGKSFVHREHLAGTIRVRTVQQQHNGSPRSDVILFLNFRRNKYIQRARPNDVMARLADLTPLLYAIADEPFLDEQTAWRLRSMSQDTLRYFTKVFAANYTSTDQHQQDLHALWSLLVQHARHVLHPDDPNACNICQLHEVTRDGDLRLLAGEPSDEVLDWKSITHYVSRTGQLFVVQDVRDYPRNAHFPGRSIPFDPSARPEYVRCSTHSRSELTCPLVVQGKVVGVLNVESTTAQRYGAREALLFYLYATTAALSLRQSIIFRDLRASFRLHNDVLALTNEAAVLERTLSAVADLDYIASIWTFAESGSPAGWVPGSRAIGTQVRSKSGSGIGGHTQFIQKRQMPIALTDCSLSAPVGSAVTQVVKKAGVLDALSLFSHWTDFPATDPVRRIRPNPYIWHLMSPKAPKGKTVLCDFGFPIFRDRGCRDVKAVLWAKCYRHFLSVLDEEMWFLSLVCRTASEACRAIRERQQATSSTRRFARRAFLKYHFGERAPQCDTLPRECFGLKERSDLIVLYLDVRDSTTIANDAFRSAQGDVFQKFIEAFHQCAHDAIVTDGAFDKSVGDEVIGLFNIFRPGVMPLRPFVSKIRSIEAAVDCAFSVFNRFASLIPAFDRNNDRLKFDPTMAVGGAIALGNGFIGGPAGQVFEGAEYTVYGDVANWGGKLVPNAKRSYVEERLDEVANSVVPVVGRGPLSGEEVGMLRRYLKSRSAHVLLCTTDIDVSEELGKKYAFIELTVPRIAKVITRVYWVMEWKHVIVL